MRWDEIWWIERWLFLGGEEVFFEMKREWETYPNSKQFNVFVHLGMGTGLFHLSAWAYGIPLIFEKKKKKKSRIREGSDVRIVNEVKGYYVESKMKKIEIVRDSNGWWLIDWFFFLRFAFKRGDVEERKRKEKVSFKISPAIFELRIDENRLDLNLNLESNPNLESQVLDRWRYWWEV